MSSANVDFAARENCFKGTVMHARGDLAVAARDTALDGGRGSKGCHHEIALVDDGVIGEAGPGVGIGRGIQAREFAGDYAGNVDREGGCWCGRRNRPCVLGIFFKNILEEFSQWLIVSSLMEGHAKYSISPIKDDKLDLVIPADPKPLYNPMSRTFSIR